MLKISNLTKTFADGTRALRDVSLNVKKGEFVVILGPSGSGKTTLLRTINRLVEPDGGEILIDGEPVGAATLPQVRKKVGMIFQDFNLVSNLSALNNVLTGLLDDCGTLASIFYLFERQHKLRALESLDRVGLLPKAYSRASQLSGGQQQRVGIARAIAKRPLMMLADEPVASLDPMIAFDVLMLLKDICVDQGITVICNLHQVDFALRFADRIVGLADGRILMDQAAGKLDREYIQNIYRGYDQGMFFGPGAENAPQNVNVPLAP